jgi:hypothetical protein
MNIFALDNNPKQAAQWHVDKHIVKMPLETAQMLCTVLNQNGVKTPYKSTHTKHPCTIWAGETMDNFIWLCELGLELCGEYTYRYDKVHKCESIIKECLTYCSKISKNGLTQFPQAMPIDSKKDNSIDAYRNYYIKYKHHIASWKKRDVPYWFKENL